MIRMTTFSIIVALALVVATRCAFAGVTFPGAREDEGRRVEKFYREFAAKALEMDAWSRGLKGEDRRRFVSEALKGKVTAKKTNVFVQGQKGRHRCEVCGAAPSLAIGRAGGIVHRTSSGSPRLKTKKPSPRRLVVVAGSLAPMKDVLAALDDAQDEAESRGNGWSVSLRVLVSGEKEAIQWMRRHLPGGVSVEMVRRGGGQVEVGPTEVTVVEE